MLKEILIKSEHRPNRGADHPLLESFEALLIWRITTNSEAGPAGGQAP